MGGGITYIILKKGDLIMKRFIAIAIAAVCLASSTFALDIAVGARGMFGGNVGDDYSGFDGFVGGAGAYINLDLLLGFGFQGEMNIVTNKIEFSAADKSLTTTDYYIVDFPFMVWYNLNLFVIEIGGGVGLNLSVFESDELKDNVNVGLAAGVNLKFFISDHFGIVLGAHGVFDFLPTITVTSSENSTTYTANAPNFTRKSIYGTAGLEFRF